MKPSGDIAGTGDMSMQPIKMPGARKILLFFMGAAVAACFFLCGFDFLEKKVAMDTESVIIYQTAGAGDIIEAFAKNRDDAKARFGDKYFAVHGVVQSKKDNSREFVLGTGDGTDKNGIECRASDKELIDIIKGLNVNDTVRVYGRLSAGIVSNDPGVKITGIEKGRADSTAGESYSVYGGRAVKKSSLKKRELNGGLISYYIPPAWAGVEHSIRDEGLGNIEGYQYCLNAIGNKSAYAEDFFVCYFDKSRVDKNDRNDDELIEEAIIRDIMRTDTIRKYPLKKVRTYYGANYKYYRDQYKTELGQKYFVEMIFQETGEGMIVYLYLYRDEDNGGMKRDPDSTLNDVMLTLRLVEDNTKAAK